MKGEIIIKNNFVSIILIVFFIFTAINLTYASVLDDMFNAIDRGDTLEIKELIEHNPAIVNSFENGRTPLHIASQKGHKEIVELLLLNGSDVNLKDGEGK
ncbi:MAG TPA: ankyrin repeat domain-containing protein, partial [Candidatus Eremiobacteraeota bacterium]|nr:ankyrin repeat domain-containing protein [Candidatus Eremiobacteraeota bacterium]